ITGNANCYEVVEEDRQQFPEAVGKGHRRQYHFRSASVHPRDLHSFPTRRSSDLAVVYMTFEGPTHFQEDWVVPRFRLIVKSDPRDRKSTRLNSSHLGTSYAVISLKEKRP